MSRRQHPQHQGSAGSRTTPPPASLQPARRASPPAGAPRASVPRSAARPWCGLRMRLDVQQHRHGRRLGGRVDTRRSRRLCRRTSSRQHRSCRQHCRPSPPGAPPLVATGTPVPPHRVVAGDKTSAKLPHPGPPQYPRRRVSPASKFPIADTGAECWWMSAGHPGSMAACMDERLFSGLSGSHLEGGYAARVRSL